MAREHWASNWRGELIRYLDEQDSKVFEYGRHDCLLMTAGAVEVVTGVDHAKPYRGRYTSLAAARKLIGKSPLHFVRGILPEIHPSEALDGDVLAIRQGKDWVFGVLFGAFVYVVRQDGLGLIPRTEAEKAFRVE